MGKKRRQRQSNAEAAFRRLRGFRGWSRGTASRGKIYTLDEIEAFAKEHGFEFMRRRKNVSL